MTRFTLQGLLDALVLLAGLGVGMAVREYARAWAAARAGDPTPRLWGRVTLAPRSWFDPFGSGLVPGLIGVLWAANIPWIPAAYGKPAPVDPVALRTRAAVVRVSLAGPLATLGLAVLVGVLVRLVDPTPAAGLFAPSGVGRSLRVLAFGWSGLTVFHLLPIPGLDGARIVGLLLPPRAAEVYRNADHYLALFVLAVLFLFGSGILGGLTAAVCTNLAAGPCV
ncbi:MAG: hypothetical protein KatS3mg013_0413 [Actinomycetota bacterium]|nr:MAG: hypothetical protein KatS3mg013_0413 [Actinomycetota bacterium]